MAHDIPDPRPRASGESDPRAAAVAQARLVVVAVTVGNRPVAEVAATMGVSRSWVYELLARYRAEGEAAFEPASRAPKTSPHATPPDTVALVLQLRSQLTSAGHDAGPDTIAWHLAQHHAITLSRATIHRILTRHGLITPEPRKRPNASRVRHEASRPNQTWQSDHTRYPLSQADGLPEVEAGIVTWLDDCTRYVLHVSAHPVVTIRTVLAALRVAAAEHGVPASVLIDNGRGAAGRRAGPSTDGRAAFEAQLGDWGTVLVGARAAHPSARGKVGRFHQTMRRWLRAQPQQPRSIPELQALLEVFRMEYNTGRPHRSLPQQVAPAALYESLPRVGPPGGMSGMS